MTFHQIILAPCLYQSVYNNFIFLSILIQLTHLHFISSVNSTERACISQHAEKTTLALESHCDSNQNIVIHVCESSSRHLASHSHSLCSYTNTYIIYCSVNTLLKLLCQRLVCRIRGELERVSITLVEQLMDKSRAVILWRVFVLLVRCRNTCKINIKVLE